MLSAALVALTMFSMLDSGPELGTRTPKEILFIFYSYLVSVISTLWYFKWRLYQSTTLAATSSK